MKRFVIKNADGTQQYVMPAVHDTRKKAENTLMGYIQNYNKFNEEYLSLFDFVIEVEECYEPSKIIPDFERAKQAIGFDVFILAKESFCFRDVEINYKHMTSLIAMNQLLSIAEAWNKLDEFVPNLSDISQKKWHPWFKYRTSENRFVYAGVSLAPAVFDFKLSFKTKERAQQFGMQFVDLYNKIFL